MGSEKLHRVMFLYTEIAPYFIACLRTLVETCNAEVLLVRWPINSEAPFSIEIPDRVTLLERADLDTDKLIDAFNIFSPQLVLASGWVDKGYLKVCRVAKSKGVPTIMCSDTAWRGDMRQLAAVLASKLWLRRTFSHAWVSGSKQAVYARKLGFNDNCIYTGFYCADVDSFGPFGERFMRSKKLKYPHVFLCVARYIHTKGHQYMCEAFAELADSGDVGDWTLKCVGTGELYPMQFQHPRIEHVGFMQPDDLPTLQEQCGAFILPSMYEPWGVVVQEHALAGFPMLLSSAVGAKERFLLNGENGYDFEAGSKESLKEAIKRLASCSDEQLLSMGDRSISLASSWTPKNWTETILRIFQDR